MHSLCVHDWVNCSRDDVRSHDEHVISDVLGASNSAAASTSSTIFTILRSLALIDQRRERTFGWTLRRLCLSLSFARAVHPRHAWRMSYGPPSAFPATTRISPHLHAVLTSFFWTRDDRSFGSFENTHEHPDLPRHGLRSPPHLRHCLIAVQTPLKMQCLCMDKR